MIKLLDLSPRVIKRFWKYVDKQPIDQCWNWQAATDKGGYGRLQITENGRKFGERAHRISWVIHNGEPPHSAHVLHRCDNPTCVNPGHLFLGDQKDNNLDRKSKNRYARGDTHKSAKMSESAAREIFIRVLAGENNVAVAALYGVTISAVSNIMSGRKWKHVTAGVKLNRPRSGERSGAHKISDAEVAELRRLASTGTHTADLADMFQISKDQVRNIVTYKQRKFVTQRITNVVD